MNKIKTSTFVEFSSRALALFTVALVVTVGNVSTVSTDGVFKSKVMDTDEKFSHTFDKAGTYPYYCTIHPKMTGKVVVH